MEKLLIQGGYPLHGTLRIGGAKNAALPIIASTILTDGTTTLEDVPRISDIDNLLKMLSSLGCSVQWQDGKLHIDTTTIKNNPINDEIAKKIRGSIFVLGALVARFKSARLPFPGGCAIGERPVDIHINAFKDIGISTQEQCGYIQCRRKSAPKMAAVHLDFPSVGATINVILATAIGKRTVKIIGAAREPEIVDLADFLNKCGACISGAGTDTITVSGAKSLSGTKHKVISDRIVSGSYMLLTAAVGGDVTLENVNPSHNENLISKLISSGVDLTQGANSIRIKSIGTKKPFGSVQTSPYPGFSTDLQSQVTAYALTCKGRTTVTENMFENRFGYVAGLEKLGGKVTKVGKKIIIEGSILKAGTKENPVEVFAPDLRGGFSLVMAAMAADGFTVIHNAQYIRRGYQDLETGLIALGGNLS